MIFSSGKLLFGQMMIRAKKLWQFRLWIKKLGNTIENQVMAVAWWPAKDVLEAYDQL